MSVFRMRAVVVVMALAMSACATTKEKVVNFRNYSENRSDLDSISLSESKYYKDVRGRGDGRPKVGLALSGGGQRSAATSIGFLEAMTRSGLINDIDVVSSVSGGSYAAYWWYTRKYWSDKEGDGQALGDVKGDQRFFERYFWSDSICPHLSSLAQCNPDNGQKFYYDNYRFYFQSINNGHLLTNIQYPVGRNWVSYAARMSELVPKGLVSWAVAAPASFVVNGIFDMKLNVKPWARYYANGIERQYGVYPLPDTGSDEKYPYANLARFGLGTSADPEAGDLFASMKKQKMPFWVINATAAYGKRKVGKIFSGFEGSGYSNSLPDTVYEFSPVHQGSPIFGNCDYKNGCAESADLKLSKKIEISGAAVDSLPKYGNVALDVLNASLGRYIENPLAGKGERLYHNILPFPLYLLDQAPHDEKASKIYLSDGGHSDNLGVYSVIRRGVDKVIVLDAAHEGDDKKNVASFDDLLSTRCHLYHERGLVIDIPGIADGSVDMCPGKDDAIAQKGFNFKKAAASVFEGVICEGAGQRDQARASCGTGTKKVASIYYAKLSINADQMQSADYSVKGCVHDALSDNTRYSCETVDYFLNARDNKDFPQDSTADVFYSPEQFAGYSSLGYDIGRELVRNMARK